MSAMVFTERALPSFFGTTQKPTLQPTATLREADGTVEARIDRIVVVLVLRRVDGLLDSDGVGGVPCAADDGLGELAPELCDTVGREREDRRPINAVVCRLQHVALDVLGEPDLIAALMVPMRKLHQR